MVQAKKILVSSGIILKLFFPSVGCMSDQSASGLSPAQDQEGLLQFLQQKHDTRRRVMQEQVLDNAHDKLRAAMQAGPVSPATVSCVRSCVEAACRQIDSPDQLVSAYSATAVIRILDLLAVLYKLSRQREEAVDLVAWQAGFLPIEYLLSFVKDPSPQRRELVLAIAVRLAHFGMEEAKHVFKQWRSFLPEAPSLAAHQERASTDLLLQRGLRFLDEYLTANPPGQGNPLLAIEKKLTKNKKLVERLHKIKEAWPVHAPLVDKITAVLRPGQAAPSAPTRRERRVRFQGF